MELDFLSRFCQITFLNEIHAQCNALSHPQSTDESLIYICSEQPRPRSSGLG